MFWGKTYLTRTSVVPGVLIEKQKVLEWVKLGCSLIAKLRRLYDKPSYLNCINIIKFFKICHKIIPPFILLFVHE